ncbi:uncharacterized protein LOC141902060 [Tubulanus polymorphus]|uniref:uncharacterized protein LOC141902060 n=1 Tax=Tubulanus polymorphus TaxID=672921 RepID=UPI003DA38FFE
MAAMLPEELLNPEPAAEGRINLGALQQRDPYITDIVDTASQVALYLFNPKQSEWEKTDIEGTLFVYTRSAPPINGFMILNRLGLNNQIEPITKDLEFQLQDPFLLYKNAQANIFGIWFYDKDECARLGQLMNSLVQVAAETYALRADSNGRLRRASESDTMFERRPKPRHHNQNNTVDILQLLSKAQHEYDQTKSGGIADRSEPKPMISNPGCSVNGKTHSPIRKPKPVRPDHENVQVSSTPINLEALFGASRGTVAGASAAQRHSNQDPHELKKGKQKPRSKSTAAIPVRSGVEQGPDAQSATQLLMRLMSNPGNMVDEIERKQMEMGGSGDACDQNMHSAKSTGAEPMVMDYNAPPSPATDLKMKLNMIMTPKTPQSKTTSAGDSVGLRTVQSSSNLLTHLSSGGAGDGYVTKMHACMSETNMLSLVSPDDTVPMLSQPAMFSQTSGSSQTLQKNSSAVSPSVVDVMKMNSLPEKLGAAPLLLKPDDLMASSANPASLDSKKRSVGSLTPNSKPMPPPASVLMSPMAFQVAPQMPPLGAAAAGTHHMHHSASAQALHQLAAPYSMTSSVSPPLAMEMDTINPLTKEQLQQSLLFLLKNDSTFLDTIHNAYIQSLQKH